jgi:hypothetical protein
MKYGDFSSVPGGFTIREAELVRPWHYIYTNDHMLLKVNQRGPVLAQAQPPCGIPA